MNDRFYDLICIADRDTDVWKLLASYNCIFLSLQIKNVQPFILGERKMIVTIILGSVNGKIIV